MSIQDQFHAKAGRLTLEPLFCPQCKGGMRVAQIMEGQGLVQGPCYCCLGDGKARALPAPGQKVTLMAQWANGDGLVEGFEVSGMLVVPAEDGAYYVTRQNAMRFFGLIETPPDVTALQEEIRVGDKLLEQRNRVLAEIPECPPHGDQCVPHAIEWVRKARARGDRSVIERLQGVVELLRCGRAGEARDQIAALTSEMERSAA